MRKEVHDLHDLGLDVIDARDVGERGALGGLRVVLVGAGLTQAAQAAHPGHAAAHPPVQQQAEQYRGAEPQQQVFPPRSARRIGRHRHAVGLQLAEQVVVGPGRRSVPKPVTCSCWELDVPGG
jgi:hypothetical protein